MLRNTAKVDPLDECSRSPKHVGPMVVGDHNSHANYVPKSSFDWRPTNTTTV